MRLVAGTYCTCSRTWGQKEGARLDIYPWDNVSIWPVGSQVVMIKGFACHKEAMCPSFKSAPGRKPGDIPDWKSGFICTGVRGPIIDEILVLTHALWKQTMVGLISECSCKEVGSRMNVSHGVAFRGIDEKEASRFIQSLALSCACQ